MYQCNLCCYAPELCETMRNYAKLCETMRNYTKLCETMRNYCIFTFVFSLLYVYYCIFTIAFLVLCFPLTDKVDNGIVSISLCMLIIIV